MGSQRVGHDLVTEYTHTQVIHGRESGGGRRLMEN